MSQRIFADMIWTTVLVAGLGLYIWKQRQHIRHLEKTVDVLRKGHKPAKQPNSSTADAEGRGPMPEHTKRELLKKLERFESSLEFTEKDISIAVLAGKMKTNTKYLSHVINNCRNKDFNTYINELRINFIILKMKSDKRYRNYKISYLAEVCGFTSHSQFTTVFRSITGMSPSRFMTQHKEIPDY